MISLITANDWRELPSIMWGWKNFTPQELACRGSGAIRISIAALDNLQELRNRVARPMHINSAYRSPDYNKSIGGAPDSRHMISDAFDVRMAEHDPIAFEKLAREVGFSGFGFYPAQGFMHIDMGPGREWGVRFK